ncbi:MAG TPA: hypothetical protein VFX76_09065, partial [Roseiflexaceae bacterium]|nr:hypothetical protein [Roseiflexaceae bacterium]
MTVSPFNAEIRTLPFAKPLDGAWHLLPIDQFRQGFYPLDDESWIEQQLPAHWQQEPLLESYAGKMVYRKRFTLQELGVRSWELAAQTPTPNSQPPTP